VGEFIAPLYAVTGPLYTPPPQEPKSRDGAQRAVRIIHDVREKHHKPAKHELGWADYQTRQGRAMVRHWVLVMLAFTFSLLTLMVRE
jgi:hypothetical protein